MIYDDGSYNINTKGKYYTNWTTFGRIAKEYYQEYLKADKEFYSFIVDNEYIIDEHGREENLKFRKAFRAKEKYAMSTVLFVFLGIESYINFLIVYKRGQAEFDRDFKDILDFQRKLSKAMGRCYTRYPLAKRDVSKRIGKLQKIRNNIVHEKATLCEDADDNYYTNKYGDGVNDMYQMLESLVTLLDDMVLNCEEEDRFYKSKQQKEGE